MEKATSSFYGEATPSTSKEVIKMIRKDDDSNTGMIDMILSLKNIPPPDCGLVEHPRKRASWVLVFLIAFAKKHESVVNHGARHSSVVSTAKRELFVARSTPGSCLRPGENSLWWSSKLC